MYLRKISCSSTNLNFRLFIIALLMNIMPGVATMNVYGQDKSSKMTNDAIGQPFSEKQVESPVEYFRTRYTALELVRQENWRAAKPLLRSLTSSYPDDGDTWYMLGMTYFQLGEWQKSVSAFEKTIALGTILSDVPGGSAPSNDIMIKIAQAYAELGQGANAINWINRALEARYDEKHRLSGNAHFTNTADSGAFKKAVGVFLPENLSRVQGWRYDLNYLVSEIKRLHVNMYHAVDKNAFEEMVASIHHKIPTLSDQEIVFEFMTLVSVLGNGHNFIIPTFNEKGAFSQLPVQFYKFSDGLFIVAADTEYKALIGLKVLAIGNTPVLEALSKVKRINARDNEMQQLWLGPHYLGLPQVLKGLGIVASSLDQAVENSTDIALTLENSGGARLQEIIKIKPRAMVFNGFPKLPAVDTEKTSDAIHNLKMDQQYWYQPVPDENALYIQYNYVHNNPNQSFEDFNKELRGHLSKSNVQYLILDIRHNAGGDGSTYPPILKTLVQFEVLNPQGKIFVIMGRNTFSAAHNLLLDISKLTNAILVGEPSGSRPNALSEAGWLRLPYSGTLGIISSQFHQPSKAEDHRIWVAPHVPVSLSSAEYFAGQDPAMNAIFDVIADM